MKSVDHMKEFVCLDCGARVVQLTDQHANDQDLCFTCSWLRAHPDCPDDVRRRLRGDDLGSS